MEVKSLKELEKELQKRIDYVLLTDVTDVVTEIMIEHINNDVYAVYEPRTYRRRMNNGGLSSPDNINSSIEGDTLIVENNTMANPYIFIDGIDIPVMSINAGKELTPIIEMGEPYEFDWGLNNIPRPFIHNTIAEIKANNYHVRALKEGLRKQGIEVE